ncbi:hypothetical protein SOVF_192970 [Spinacia oleracea]|nr:hypothetical protein SOVF_192970 [Spinacia oleracea]
MILRGYLVSRSECFDTGSSRSCLWGGKGASLVRKVNLKARGTSVFASEWALLPIGDKSEGRGRSERLCAHSKHKLDRRRECICFARDFDGLGKLKSMRQHNINKG